MIVYAFALVAAQPVAAPQSPPAPPANATSSTTIDPDKLAIGRDIIAVVLPPEQRVQMMTNVLNAMMGNMVAGLIKGVGLEDDLRDHPELREVFTRFVDRQRELALDDIKTALPDLVEAYARSYARVFSIEDLRAIKAFVATPAGVHFVQRGPQLIADPDVAGWQRKLAEQGAARQSAEIARLKAELEEARKSPPGKS